MILLAEIESGPVSFAPLLHPAATALLTGGAAVLAIRLRLSRATHGDPSSRADAMPLLLRLAALALLAVLLLNPVRIERGSDVQQRQGVTLMVDRSSSMCVSDEHRGGEPLARLERLEAAWLSREFLDRLAAHGDVQLLAFAEEVIPIGPTHAASLEADGEETRLAEHLRAAIERADDSGATIVLLTDGRDTDGGSVAAFAAEARRRGVVVSAVLVGTVQQQPDLNVRLSADHAFVHFGQPTVLRGEIHHVGLEGGRIAAVLEHNGREIERTDLVLGPDAARVSYSVVPEAPAGETREMVSMAEFRLRVEPLPAESRTDNNEAYAFVQITRQHLRVVLFENSPYWDTKFLISALRDAAEIDLTTVIGLGRREEITRFVSQTAADPPPQDAQAPAPTAPTTLDQLAGYDVVILGRGIERWFPGHEAETLVTYVMEQGGSLVLARGRPFGSDNPHGVAAAAAIDPLLPVQWAEGKISGGVLRAGGAMSVGDPLSFGSAEDTDLILSSLPGMTAQTRIERERAASIIWARTASPGGEGVLPAAVATQHIGHGRVLAILVDGLWRWAMLPPADADLDPVYPLFWTRAVRWLAGGGELLPGQSIGLSLSRLNVRPGQSVEIIVQSRYVDSSRFDPTLTVMLPDGSRREIEPAAANESGTRLTASFTPTIEGLHTVRLEAPEMSPPSLTSRFVVHDPSRERLDLSADHAPLEALAHATGGKRYSPDDPDALLDDLRAQQIALEGEAAPRPVWDRSWMLALLMTLLGVEWLWRRWIGQM